MGPEGERLARRARELGAPVAFPGFVADADLPALYSGATCFVTASRYEGFGLPALEAISCGTPVVAFDAGAVPEVAGPGGAAGSRRGPDRPPPRGRPRSATRSCSAIACAPTGWSTPKRYSWQRTAELTWEAYERCLAY